MTTTFATSFEKAHTHVSFGTFADYVSAAESKNPSHLAYSGFKDSSDFTAYASLRDARTFLTHGWPEGAAKVRSVSERVKQAIPDSALNAFRPQQIWDVTGLSLDVATFLDGQPECFMDEIIPERGDHVDGNGIVRISINLWASCGITPEELQTLGVFVAALADVLETIGYSAQIDGIICSATDHDVEGKMVKRPLVITFPIKRYDEALEIDRLPFILAHPASLRQLGFHVMDVVGSRASYYGSPCKLPAGYAGDVLVNALEWRSHEDYDTAKAILGQLKALGIDLDLDSTSDSL